MTPAACSGPEPWRRNAFGLGLDSYHGTKCVYHTGSWAGDCGMLWLPEKQFGVAVFANGPGMDPGRMAFDIADICLAHRIAKGGADDGARPGSLAEATTQRR